MVSKKKLLPPYQSSVEIKQILIITFAMLWIRWNRFPTSIIPCRKKNTTTRNIQTMYFSFKRNVAGRMSQQQTPCPLPTANQQLLRELQRVSHSQRPKYKTGMLEGCPLSPKPPSNPTATEAMQVALNILSLPTLSGESTVRASEEHTLHSNGRGRIQLMTPIFKSQRVCRNGSFGKFFFLKASVRYNKATIASIYILIQRDLFMRSAISLTSESAAWCSFAPGQSFSSAFTSGSSIH